MKHSDGTTPHGSLFQTNLRESAERLSSVASMRPFTPAEGEEAVDTLLAIPALLDALGRIATLRLDEDDHRPIHFVVDSARMTMQRIAREALDV